MPQILVSPEGTAVVVPDDEIAARKRLGYTEETSRDAAGRTADQQVQEENTTLAAKAKAAAGGFARGATFGLSDVAINLGSDEESLRSLRNVREANPNLSTGFEIAGAVAPALLSGGSSAAGTIARATPAGALSGATARFAAKGGILRGAAAGAGEGAAQSAGAYLSEAALEDKAISAEGFIAAGAPGAVFGGAVGGGLAAAEKGMIAARKLFPKFAATEEAVTRAADNVDVELTKALNTGDESVRRAKDQLELMRLQKMELGVAAEARVLEKRAAEAAKAQAQAEIQAQKLATQQQLDEVRIAKAKAPRTSRPGKGNKTESPVAGTVDDVVAPPDLPTYDAIGSDAVDLTVDPGQIADRLRTLPPGDGPGPFGQGTVKAERGRRAIEEGQRDPVSLSVRPDGTYEVTDGRHRMMAAIEAGKPVKVRVERGAIADGPDALVPFPSARRDVAGAPLGNVSPSAGGDLESLLGQSLARVKAGEPIEALAREARPPTALDEIHEAMAELDPEAARLVNAVRAQEAAAAALTKRFKVRAPQQIGGSTTKVIPDAPDLTLGRVKQMYTKANAAEKAALLQQIGPEKAKALLEIVEGRAGFAKWYKNKGHWWDDPSYGPLPTQAGPSPEDLDIIPGFAPGAHVDALADEAHVVDMGRAVDEISAYERSVSDLAEALGPNAPPSAADMAARYGAALDDNARKSAERLAQVADDAPVPSPVLAQGSGPVPAPPMAGLSPTPVTEALTADAAAGSQLAQATDLIATPGAASALTPKKKGGLLGLAADAMAANEAMQAVGISLPFIPDVEQLPVVGPLLGAYFKLRAGMTVLGKAGFKVPLTGEARIASGAAATRERVAKSVDRLLGAGAKTAAAVRAPLASQAWRAPDVLKAVLYDTGEKPKRGKGEDVGAMLQARGDELLAAQANPAGVKSMVRELLRDVRDPDVIAAVTAVQERKLSYLAKHVPVAPPRNLLSKSKWAPSPAEVERFARRVRAANDPVTVLEDVAQGRITPEAAETLREVYPALYAEAQTRLLQQATKLQQSLPHATVVRLSVLFDAPLVSSLEPENLMAIQAAGQPQVAQGPGGPPPNSMSSPPPGGAPDLGSLYMTPGEKRAAR